MSAHLPRIVCQFSCGAASAVATKLALADYGATHDVQILNAYLANEHPDNRRFLADCEAWFEQPVTVLRDEKYGADIIEVFRRERFMKNQYGAPCTKLLKRRLLDTWKLPGDVMVFGYTAEEADRLEDFRERNPDRPVIAPLIERGLGKEDCKAMIQRAGIELPVMYRMGYDNASDAAWIRFRVTPELQAVISRCRDNVASPYLVHRRPERLKQKQAQTKDHWTKIEERYLTRAFKAAREDAGCYADWSDEEMPGFHEVRALSLHLYKKAQIGRAHV